MRYTLTTQQFEISRINTSIGRDKVLLNTAWKTFTPKGDKVGFDKHIIHSTYFVTSYS